MKISNPLAADTLKVSVTWEGKRHTYRLYLRSRIHPITGMVVCGVIVNALTWSINVWDWRYNVYGIASTAFGWYFHRSRIER